MQDIVLCTIAEHQLLDTGDYVLVAVSGGPDSVALLHWLYTHQQMLQIRLACAHFNHGFRDQESDEDEAFVANLCRQWEVPYFQQKANLKPLIEAGGVNLQAISREYRYRFLLETAEQIGAGRIALAHHRDDQVETIMMRFLRGTGTTGLIGMPYERSLSVSVSSIRPFLDITKDQILSYLKLHHLPSRIDSSNLKTDYTRNRIRLELLPQLQQYNVNFSSSILSLARMLEEDEAEIMRQAREQFEQITNISNRSDDGEIRLKLSDFRLLSHSLQRRVIKLICNYLSKNEEEVPFLHIEAVRSLCLQDEPRQWDLPWSIRLYVRYGEALFKRLQTDSTVDPFYCLFNAPATILLPQTNDRITCSITTVMDEPENDKIAYFDYDRIQQQLIIRTRVPGDRIWIEGLAGHKKVKDIFIDNKIPREERERIPLLFAGDALLWIVGVRKSSYGKVNQNTKRFLRCSYEQVNM